MKTEDHAWRALQDRAAAQLRAGFSERVLRAARGPQAETWRELQAHAAAQLRPQDRALLALVQEGRSHAEIAEILSTSVAAVKARLHRAREHLREHYQPEHET